MILVILTALTAVCGAAKLDQNYLPPISARTAGGSPGALLAPLDGSNQGLGGLPTGSYTNEVQGVIVDAANPGSRAGAEPTGLGGSRASYGSTDSKVGEAAFTGSATGSGSSGVNTRIAPGFGSFVDSDGSQADKTSGNTLKFTSDVGLENYSYGFETDNGISVGENGVASGGVQAQGGYSYKGDDGKTYSVTYTADKDGYKPQGQHLPTPHPIPEEILKSLEKNAKEEAAGHVDDGSYDAQKYNDEGDYSSNGASNNNARPTIGGGATTSSSSSAYASQSSQASRPTSGVLIGSYKPDSVLSHSAQGSASQGFGQEAGNKYHSDSSEQSSSFEGQIGQSGSSNPQGSNTFGSYGSSGSQNAQTAFTSHSTENRFGIEATNEGHQGSHQTQGSLAGSPVRTPSLNNLPSSAYSSASTTGSGSASAFASTGPIGSGLKNEFIAPFNSFGSAGQHAYGSKSGSHLSAGESFPAPSSATASASVSGSQTQQYNGIQNTLPFPSVYTQEQSPSSASASASVSGNQHEQFNGFNTDSNSNNFQNRFGDGFDSSSAIATANSQPSSAHSSQVSSSASGSSGFGFESQSFDSKPVQNAGQIHSGSTNTQFLGVKPTKPTFGFENNHGSTKVDTDTNGSSQASAFNYQSSNEASHSFSSNNVPVSSPVTSVSSAQAESIDAALASSTQQPALSQQQGVDDSYFYKQPSKPFVIPSVSPSSQYSNNRQPNFPASSSSLQGSKYPNKPISPTTGQYQGTSSSSLGGITQAGVSPFTSDTSSSSTQFASQSSQFGSKPAPSTQFGQSLSSQQTTTQFEATGTQIGQKPIVQSQVTDNSKSPTQQYQGTIYQYNKPEVTLSAQGHKDSSSTLSQVKPSQILTDNKFGTQQSSSQFGSQSSFQQTQTNQASNVVGSQFGQKPIVSSQTTGSNYQQTQFGSGSQFNQKPQTIQSSFTSTNTQNQQSQFTKPQTFTQSQTQFGQKPSQTTQTQLGSGSSQFNQKPQLTQGTSSTSSFSQTAFGQKPVGTTQSGSSYQQTQFGLNSSQFGQKPQTQGSSFTSTANTQNQQSQFTKPQTTVGSSVTGNTFSQSLTQFGKKPSETTQTGSSFQQTQFGSSQFNQKPQITQSSGLTSTSSQTLFGQKPVGTTQTGSTYQQTQFGLSSSQLGQKPQTTGSSFTSNKFSQGNTFQFEKKPVISTQTGSTSQQTQFGSTASQFAQNSQSVQGSGLSSTTAKPSFGQKPFGSSYQQNQLGSTASQYGQNSQSTQSSGLSSINSQTSFSKKPTYQQSQFGSGSSQFTQAQTGQFENKPISTTQTGSVFQQTQSGSQFGQKPLTTQFGSTSQTSQGLGSTSSNFQTSFGSKPVNQQNQFGSIGSQLSQTSQYNKKPTTQAGSTFQQNQFGVEGNKFAQSSQSTQFGVTSTTAKPSFGQKPFGSSYQQTQQSQFGQKPLTTQFGSTSSQFGQSSQTSQGSGSTSTTSQTSYGIKPVYQQPQFGSGGTQFSQTSQFGKNPTSLSGTTTQTGSVTQQSSTQFGQKPQISQGSSFNSNTFSQGQTTQVVNKPTQTSSTFQQSQLGSAGSQSPQFGQKPQTTASTGSTSSFGQSSFAQKPSNTAQTSSYYQQSQSSSSSSQASQKPQSTSQGFSYTTNTGSKGQTGQTSQFGQTGFGQNTGFSSQNAQVSGSQYGQKPQLNAGVVSQNQFGQTSQSGNKLSGSSSASGSGFQQTQFSSSSGAQFGQTTQGSSQAQAVQTAQFGVKPFGSSQSTQGSTQFGSTQSQFGQTSQSSQDNVPTLTTISQTVKPTQFGYKPFGATQNSGSSFQTTHFNTEIKKPYGVVTTPAPIRFGSTAAHFGQKPQAQASAFASGSNSNVASFGTTQTGQVSKYQQSSQLGVQNQAVTTTQKPLVSSLSQTNYQQSQYTQTLDRFGSQPQFGQASQTNVGTGDVAGQTAFGAELQKPFGSQSTQTTYQQTQINQGQKPLTSSQGSAFQTGQSGGIQSTQSNVQSSSVTGQSSQSSFGTAQSANGYNYQQPQSVFTTQFGSQAQNQKVQQTLSNFNSVVSTTQKPINSQPNSFGISSTQGSFQQTQSASTQFGAQSTKPEISGPVIQTTYNKFNGQPFKPVSTASTQGSNYQSQNSVVSTSQFGVQPTKPASLAQFSGQPFQSTSTHSSGFESQSVVGSTPQYSIQPTQGLLIGTQKPSQTQFSGEASFPSKVGSNINGQAESLAVSTVQKPVPIPGYEIVSNQGFVGQLEQFGGPRDPPRFDDKTGYHY